MRGREGERGSKTEEYFELIHLRDRVVKIRYFFSPLKMLKMLNDRNNLQSKKTKLLRLVLGEQEMDDKVTL